MNEQTGSIHLAIWKNRDISYEHRSHTYVGAVAALMDRALDL